MPSKKISGEMTQYETPNWDPLLELLAEYLASDFMWMHEVELKDGTRLHAYKNRETRRYLHLSLDGRAFVYCEDGRYSEVEISRMLLERVLAMTPRWAGE